jgi:hypothetical protein
VADFGAVAGDNTALQAANTIVYDTILARMVRAGGGRMQFPAGIWHGKIRIPARPFPDWISIEIEGESRPDLIFGTVPAAWTLPTHRTILRSLDSVGAVIYADSVAGPNNISFVHVSVKNLEVRTYDNPHINGIDLFYTQQCASDWVVVGTGLYNPNCSQPTVFSKGFVTSGFNNAACNRITNTLVYGYNDGFYINEHTSGDNLKVAACNNGLNFRAANHGSFIGFVDAMNCPNVITVGGIHRFVIGLISTEHFNSGWQMTVNDLYDPGNVGYGKITWDAVTAAGGPDHTFTKTGGIHVKCDEAGFFPVGTLDGSPDYKILTLNDYTDATNMMGLIGGGTGDHDMYVQGNYSDGKIKFRNSTTTLMSCLPAGGLFISNSSAPATPTGGGVIYVESGSLKYKGSSGTVTVLGVP